jgi:hypothetical protein
MKKIKWLMILLMLLGSVGCGVTVKLNGFQEIAERNQVGMEEATATPEGAELLSRIQEGVATPTDLNVARQMLKDNNITVSAESSSPLINIAEALPYDDSEKKIISVGS